MTEDAPRFDVLWPELEPFFKNYIVIAHNASFDMGVIRHTLDHFGISYPNTSYFCTGLLLEKSTLTDIPLVVFRYRGYGQLLENRNQSLISILMKMQL